MRVAVITEGVSEFKSLPMLYTQIKDRVPHVVVNPLKVNVSPDAPPAVVARECKSRLLIASAQGASLCIVLLDREEQPNCPGAIADGISAEIAKLCPSIPVRVVLKDRAFENWLVADLGALESQPKRFRVTASLRRAVQPNKADKVDAIALLKAAVLGGDYDKVADSQRICARSNVATAALHSRSLRHFLHVLDDVEYGAGCRRPVRPG